MYLTEKNNYFMLTFQGLTETNTLIYCQWVWEFIKFLEMKIYIDSWKHLRHLLMDMTFHICGLM
jgi:hypothetical protein